MSTPPKPGSDEWIADLDEREASRVAHRLSQHIGGQGTMLYRGAWSPGQYAAGDVTFHAGALWVALEAVATEPLDADASWQRLVDSAVAVKALPGAPPPPVTFGSASATHIDKTPLSVDAPMSTAETVPFPSPDIKGRVFYFDVVANGTLMLRLNNVAGPAGSVSLGVYKDDVDHIEFSPVPFSGSHDIGLDAGVAGQRVFVVCAQSDDVSYDISVWPGSSAEVA
jgi:hypothetical protein